MPGSHWRLIRARGQVLIAPSAPLPVLPLTAAHHAPDTPLPGEPRLSRGQRARRFARDLVVDRVGGRIGLRTLRPPRPGRPSPAVVFAETVDCLVEAIARERAATTEIPDRAVSRLTVVVGWWSAPWRGWTGRPGPLPGLLRQRVRFPARGRGPVTVRLELAQPVPLHRVLTAALQAVRPSTPIVGASTRVESRPEAVDAGGSTAGSGPVLVDEQRINPRGRRPESYHFDAPRFQLEFGPTPVLVAAPETVGYTGRNPPPWEWPGSARWRRGDETGLGWRTLTALRSVGRVECVHLPGADPVVEASLLAQLAMTGVVLHVPGLTPPVADRLAPQLRGILTEPLPAKDSGPLIQEIRSVRQRRAALRDHSVQFGRTRRPTVSAILATKRAEHLPNILATIAGQTYAELEIVLCLHGIELPPACAEFIAHCGRPVEVVAVPAEVSFGVALGLATARASGTLVTKFDDDDTYGPEHVWDLVLARGFSGATLVGKGIEFVYLENADVTVRRRSGQPEADTDVVAGGTMLIARAELEELGGWRPVPRSVDRGLLDRVNRAGARIYRTHPLGYLYHRRSTGHTWAAEDEFFLRTARQRWSGLPQLPEFTAAPLPSQILAS